MTTVILPQRESTEAEYQDASNEASQTRGLKTVAEILQEKSAAERIQANDDLTAAEAALAEAQGRVAL